jgi:hypothetical protein
MLATGTRLSMDALWCSDLQLMRLTSCAPEGMMLIDPGDLRSSEKSIGSTTPTRPHTINTHIELSGSSQSKPLTVDRKEGLQKLTHHQPR